MNRLYAVLAIPFVLSGCMMLGMGGMGGGGMHGASHGASMTGQTVIKDSVVGVIRITAEFPPYMLGDALAYEVTLRDVRDDTLLSDAAMTLIVTPVDPCVEGSCSGQEDAHAGYGDSSTTRSRSGARQLQWPPDHSARGTYVFRPSITKGGAYKFVYLLQRAGAVTMEPSIRMEHVVRIGARADQHSGSGDHGTGLSMAPAALLGAGVMVIMMIFMIR